MTASIGASEVAVVLGLQRTREDGEPYTSAIELWGRLTGLLPRYDGANSPDAEIGRWVEPAIGLRFAAEHGLVFGRDILPGPTLDQPGLVADGVPWHARPDFLVPARRSTLEAKAPRALHPERWGPAGTDEVPADHAVQVLAQVAIAHRLWGVDVGELAALARAPGWGADRVWATYALPRDPVREARVIDAVRSWVDLHVEQGEPPMPDGSDSAERSLRRMFVPLGEDLVRVATPTDLEHHRRILACREAIAEIQGRLDESRQRLQLALGEATELRRGSERGELLATWRPNKHGVRSLRTRGDNAPITTEAA